MKNKLSFYFKYIFLFFLLLIVSSSSFYGQGIIPTVGKDFWLTYTENYTETPLMELFITSDQNTAGTVAMPLQGWSVNFVVTANQTTTITIPNAIVDAENTGSNIFSNKGIHVTSELDISLFAINFIGYTSDASKILPSKSIGTEYTVVSYAGIEGNYSEIAIVATQDDTEIEITPTQNITGGVAAGTTYTISLDQGETYQIQCGAANDDFTGTHIVATEESGDCRPFAVFSGSECANIPIGCTFCDMVFDQNFPSNSWGTNYLVAPFDFSSSYTYKVVAIEDNTDISVDGVIIGNINAGESIEMNSVSDAVYVSANNPINTTQFMQGVSCSVIGDPAMLILNANDQQINHVTFSTVTSTVITQHVVNIITESNYIDQVFLDGTPIDPSEFSVFPGLPSYSYAQIALSEGSHVLDSPEGFSAYVYGIGDAESYAYSVGSYSLEEPIAIYSVDCSGNQITLSPDEPLYDVWWSTEDAPDDTIQFEEDLIIVPPIETQAYILHGMSELSGCPIEYIYSVESPDEIGVDIIPDSIELCFHENHTFQPQFSPPSPNYVYNWTTNYAFENPNIANAVIQPEISGWYFLDVTTLSECGYGIDSVYVEVIGGAIADFTVSALPDALCLPDSSELLVNIQEIVLLDNFDSGIDLSQWTSISGGTNSQDCGSLSEDALYFNQASPRVAETIDLDVSQGGVLTFAIKIANGIAPCDDAELGEDVILEFSTNAGGSWSEIIILYEMLYADFTFLNVAIPPAAQTNSTRFRWRQNSASGVGEDNWSLDNVSISTTMTSPNVLWTSELGQPITNPTNVSTYSALAESNYFYCEMAIEGCNYIDSVFVVASSGVQATLHDTTLCQTLGAQINYPIDNPALYSFEWNNNSALDNPFIPFPTITEENFSGDLIVQITQNQTLCTLVDTITVTYSVLNIDFLLDSTICSGEDLIYPYDNQDLFFTWLPNSSLNENSDSELFLQPSVTTDYIYEVTDGIGCFIQDTLTISISDPYFNLGEPDILCPDDTILFDFPEFDGFMTWNSSIETSQFVIFEPGQYWANVQDQFGCEYADTISVAYHPHIEILANDSVQACPNVNFVYDATPGLASYLWSNASISPFIEPLETNEYTIIAIDEYNCVFHDTIFIEILENPEISIDGIPLICEYNNTLLTANTNATSILWSNGISSTSNNISTPGLYSVQVANDIGCINTDSIVVDQFFFGDLNLPADTFFCHGESLTLDPDYNPVITYTHYADTLNNLIEIFQPGNYTIIGNFQTCQQTTNVMINEQDLPILSYGGTTSYCPLADPQYTDVIVFSDNPDDMVYFGDLLVTENIHLNEAGEYHATVVDSFGCFSETIIPIVEICPPIVYIPNTFTPNQDGINEVFRVTALYIQKYNIVIYNHWGEIVYESNDVTKPWVGDVNKGTYYAQNDIYHYIIQVQGTDNHEYKFKGTINIIR